MATKTSHCITVSLKVLNMDCNPCRNRFKCDQYLALGRKEMFYLTTHSTHFIYGYMASDIWLRTILIARKETRCRHIGYSYRLTARVLLYAPSHRQDNTYNGLCYTSRGALAGTRNIWLPRPATVSLSSKVLNMDCNPCRNRFKCDQCLHIPCQH